MVGTALVGEADGILSLGSGVWVTSGTSGSIRVVDLSISSTGISLGLLLDTSCSAVVWNVTVAAGEACSILLNDIEWVSA